MSSQNYTPIEPRIDQNQWIQLLSNTPDLFVIVPSVFTISPPPYIWTQKDNEITVIIYNVTIDDIQVSETSISTPTLKGAFFQKIADPIMDQKDKDVHLTLHATSIFPLLISSGSDIDPFSCFICSMEALQMHSLEFYLQWIQRACFFLDPHGMHYFGRYCLANGLKQSSIYWLSQEIILNPLDVKCVVCLARIIEHDDLLLCENLLCLVARLGVDEGLFYLGKLYFNKNLLDPIKANNLIRIAALFYKLPEAVEFLEKQNSKISLADLVFSGVIVAAISFTGFFLYKRFFRK